MTDYSGYYNSYKINDIVEMENREGERETGTVFERENGDETFVNVKNINGGIFRTGPNSSWRIIQKIGGGRMRRPSKKKKSVRRKLIKKKSARRKAR